MNNDILKARWRQVRGKTKVWWAKLNDRDLDLIAGKYDILVGVLQEKYSYTRQKARLEIDKHLSDYKTSLKKVRSGSKLK